MYSEMRWTHHKWILGHNNLFDMYNNARRKRKYVRIARVSEWKRKRTKKNYKESAIAIIGVSSSGHGAIHSWNNSWHESNKNLEIIGPYCVAGTVELPAANVFENFADNWHTLFSLWLFFIFAHFLQHFMRYLFFEGFHQIEYIINT